jgi:hypothetical protein
VFPLKNKWLVKDRFWAKTDLRRSITNEATDWSMIFGFAFAF